MAHNHSHHVDAAALSRAFVVGIVLNVLFVAVEFVAGILVDSVGLMSDAGHNLSDVASLVLAMAALKLSQRRGTRNYTYGYKKSTVLISLVNAVILLVAVGFILAESIDKLFNPQPVEGLTVIWVASAGIVVNAATALLFMKGGRHDLNVRGAFLHMAADALVSVGVVVSGVVIMLTGWWIVDSIVGILIAGVILVSTWSLLTQSLRLTMDGVPVEIDYDKVVEVMRANPEVRDVHHVHIWAISTSENAITAHVVIDDAMRMTAVKHALKEILCEQGIDHATLEFETSDSPACCDKGICGD